MERSFAIRKKRNSLAVWCPGKREILSFVEGKAPLHFVVVDNGKQINQVVDANAVTAVGNRVN